MTNEQILRTRIISSLSAHPDQTSCEIAAEIGADHFYVQSEICRMLLTDRAQQTGRREIDGLPRPTYRLTTEPERSNGQ